MLVLGLGLLLGVVFELSRSMFRFGLNAMARARPSTWFRFIVKARSRVRSRL